MHPYKLLCNVADLYQMDHNINTPVCQPQEHLHTIKWYRWLEQGLKHDKEGQYSFSPGTDDLLQLSK